MDQQGSRVYIVSEFSVNDEEKLIAEKKEMVYEL